MTTISGLLGSFSSADEISLSQIEETRLGWKDALLSGKHGNDLVDLYLCKKPNKKLLLLSLSEFNEGIVNITVSEMVDASFISLGYPMIYIEEALGLKDIPVETSYSLLYRSASVILEAERLNIEDAVLLLKSTNSSAAGCEVFKNFAKLLSSDNAVNSLIKSSLKSRVNFYFGLFDSNKNQIK